MFEGLPLALKTTRDVSFPFPHGFSSFLSCLYGTINLRKNAKKITSKKTNNFHIISFSVIPWLTEYWLRNIQNFLTEIKPSITVFDSSGLLATNHRFNNAELAEVIPILNLSHGGKMDAVLKYGCDLKFVLFCDDDVFFAGPAPLRWVATLARSKGDSLVAASLQPREQVSSVLEGRVALPMGSSCIVVNRNAWQKEGLSFAIDRSPLDEGFDWYFDTADAANLALARKGIDVPTPDQEILDQIIGFEGVTSWVLKARKFRPEEFAQIAGRSEYLIQKTLRAIGAAIRISRRGMKGDFLSARVAEKDSEKLSGCWQELSKMKTKKELDNVNMWLEERFERIEIPLCDDEKT